MKLEEDISSKESAGLKMLLGPSALRKKQPTLPAMTEASGVTETKSRKKAERHLSSAPRDVTLLGHGHPLNHSRSAGAGMSGSSTLTGPLPLAPIQFPPSRESNAMTISGSEAEFLVRQIHSASSTQLSTVGRVVASSAPAASMTLQPPSPSVASTLSGLSLMDLQNKMDDALTDKIAAFEKQVALLQSIVQRREEELDKKDLKLRKVTTELDSLKKDYSNEKDKMKNQVCIHFRAALFLSLFLSLSLGGRVFDGLSFHLP